MKEITKNQISNFFQRHERLRYLRQAAEAAIAETVARVRRGGKVLICGNGGSASDSEHIAGELLKEFRIKRPIPDGYKSRLAELFGAEGEYAASKLQQGIPAIPLVSQAGIISAVSNDTSADMAYAQQVYAYAGKDDVFIGLSTSGNAQNVYLAACVARSQGCFNIGFTGESGGRLKAVSDALLNVPETETYKVQELHLPLYHLYCMCIESEMYGEG